MAQYNGTPALLHCDTAAGAKCRRASGAAVVDFRSPYRNEPTRYGHPFPLRATPRRTPALGFSRLAGA